MINGKSSVFKYFLNLKIKNKLLLFYIPLIFIPITLITLFSYIKTSQIVERQVIESTKQAFEQANRFIAYKLANIKDVSSMLYINKDLQSILGKSTDSYDLNQQIDDYNQLLDIIHSAENIKEIYSVRIYVSNDSIYSNENDEVFSIKSVEDTPWYKKVMDNRGAMYWRSTYKSHSYVSQYDQYLISCIRTINKERSEGKVVGAVSIDILEETFFRIIEQTNITKRGDILLVDGEGSIISYQDKSLIGTNISSLRYFQQAKNMDDGYEKLKVDDKMSIVYSKKIESTDWQLIALIPIEEILLPNKQIANYMSILLIVITIIAIITATLIAYGITNRFRQLIKIMKKVEVENWDVYIPIDREDEIGILQKHFNSMVENIRRLIREKYQVEVNKKNAELKLLQAQINPHFLYNTLDMINWMAKKYKAQDISLLVDGLAKFFRLSLSKGRDIISIRDELDHVLIYMDIQNKRFSNSINAIIEIEDEIYNYSTIKLVLQPIVENAIVHGIQEKEDKQGYIKITGHKEDELICITVEDNGVGMDKEVMNNILTGLRTQGYGVKNVNERIKLYFGDQYGLSFQSEIGKGTKVSIQFPAIPVNEEEC